MAYLAIRTRPAAVVWNLFPECGIFRNDGLVAYDHSQPLWVPWSAIDYYIPRQRILRLTSGEELDPLRKGPECEEPPHSSSTIADSIGDFMKGYDRGPNTRRGGDVSAVFLVARSRAVRDSRPGPVHHGGRGGQAPAPAADPAHAVILATTHRSRIGDSGLADVILRPA